jgi:uncharacterized protein YbjT (DUF2867 family)
MSKASCVAVLGASGLIGEAVARGLRASGLPTLALARAFTPAQRAFWGEGALTAPLVEATSAELAALFEANGVVVVVNCVGALQASGKGDPSDVHAGFVARLLDAFDCSGAALDPRGSERERLRALVHLSMPGAAKSDPTEFSRSKRVADADIAARAPSYAILRPGFVIAPTPYGASALLRALTQTPIGLPSSMRERPFAPVAVADVAETVEGLARRALAGERLSLVWDLSASAPSTLNEVADAFRRRFGAPPTRWAAPAWAAWIGGRAADVASRLGWLSPLRTTALKEIERGVEADPTAWIAATGARPRTLEEALAEIPADAPAVWFARLYLLKPVIIATLSLFWIVSGAMAITFGGTAARGVIEAAGFSSAFASVFVTVTSLADIAVGLAIATRRGHRAGLAAGLGLACAYLLGASVVAPQLWLDPLGPLAKVIPALAAMLASWAIFPDR